MGVELSDAELISLSNEIDSVALKKLEVETVLDGGFETSADETVKFSVLVCNDSQEPKQVRLIVPVFENGILKKVVSKAGSVEANSTLPLETDPIEIGDKMKLQGFVTAADFAPISNKIYSYVKK